MRWDGEKARQRIMAFAQQRNASKALETTVDLSQEHASHDLQSGSAKSLTGRDAADVTKAAIMGQALQASSSNVCHLPCCCHDAWQLISHPASRPVLCLGGRMTSSYIPELWHTQCKYRTGLA